MRRRLLVTSAAVVTSFASVCVTCAIGGCGSTYGTSVAPTDDGAIGPEASPPPAESGVVDALAGDAGPRPMLTPVYARGYGGTVVDGGAPITVVATGLAVDLTGGVIVAGTYRGGAIDLGNHPFAAPSGGSDAFLVQLDGMGLHRQSAAFGDQADQTGGEVVGTPGSFYASIDFAGTIAFAGNPVTSSGTGGNPNAVVARFGPQLQVAGVDQLASPSALDIRHLALGASSSVIVFGDWTNSLQVGGAASTASRNPVHPGLVVARLLGGAAPDFAHTDYCPDGTSCAGNAIATNVAAEALVGGRFMGTMAGFDGGTGISTTGDEDAYLMKLDPQLQPLWLASFGGAGVQDVTTIAAVPKTSDFVVAGVFHGSFTAPGKLPVAATDAGSDLFVMRIGPTGNVIWAKTFGGNGDDVVRGITVDADANIFLVGDFYGPGLTFGTGNDVLINADDQGRGTRDMFLAWLDGAGKHVFSRGYGSPGDESPAAVGVDGMGNIVVAGSFDQGIDFGSGLVRASGTRDMFVARLMR